MRLNKDFREEKSGFFDDNYEDYLTGSHCQDPNHNPPSMLVIPYGKKYRHICPSCGQEIILRNTRGTL